MRNGLAVGAAALVTVMAAQAWAFCGFYVAGGEAKLFNDATQVVLMRHGKRVALSMQNSYQGPPQDFAMVVPVPQVLQEENVRTLDKAIFDKIDNLTAPRLVEYWEQDPCAPRYKGRAGLKRPSARMRKSESAELLEDAGLVTVEAEFSVGEYDIVILSAKESTALETWLEAEKYEIPDGAEPYFRPYIEAGQYFFVAKVNPRKVKFENGRAVLSPLRFHYEADPFQLPIRLGLINSNGQQDLIAYVIGQSGRYEVANYPNVFIPTNLEVANAVRDDFGSFYRALFDRVTEENPKAVVTEYSWSASSCDPCPGPTLSPQDLLTLGADVMFPDSEEEVVTLDPDSAQRKPQRRRVRVRPPQATSGWTVTRLHARYGRDEIGEDLVFQMAEPVRGGNEWPRKEDGSLSQTAEPNGGLNMFQGRYIIRHEWTGEAKCENPQFGVWGGPPAGGEPKVDASPSPNTRGAAANPAKGVQLASLLKTPLPGIALAEAAEPAPKQDAVATDEKPGETPAQPHEAPKSEPPAKTGCATGAGNPSWLLALLVGFLFAKRRRR